MYNIGGGIIVVTEYSFLQQLEDGSKKEGNFILFPPADRQTQDFHLNTMMQDIAASLLMEFEKWVLQVESAGTILKTPLDSQASLSSEEVIFRCPKHFNFVGFMVVPSFLMRSVLS